MRKYVVVVRQVWPSRPASARSFSKLRLNLVLTDEIPPALRGGFHLYRRATIGSVPSLSGHAINRARPHTVVAHMVIV